MSEKQPKKTQNKKIECDNIIYSINEEKCTAGVIGFKQNLPKILIPRSIKVESKEYEVTNILSNAFIYSRIKLIQFASDSKLQTINSEAFFNSSIENITIPSSVTLIGKSAFNLCNKLQQIEIPNDSKLQKIDTYAFSSSSIKSIRIASELIELTKGWCHFTPNLTEVEVCPNNPRYCCYEGKMIIGKTNIDQSNYDCLIFCVRDIRNIKIPNFIEHICPYSFEHCKQLEHVEIPNDSKLQTIDEVSFSNSTIKSIKISSSVTLIGESAFHVCDKLQRIVIPYDSKLQRIDGYAFNLSAIESITIPSELIEFKENWCCGIKKLTKIEVSPNNPRYCCYEGKMIIGKTNIDQSNHDCLVFCVRDIKYIQIPDFIKHICSFSFEHCEKLEHVEIPNGSKLQTIDESVFSYSVIKNIRIPSSVTLIGDHAFSDCKQFKKIDISNDSKLQVIGNHAFYSSAIESIAIPSSVIYIGNNAFSLCKQLHIIEINIEMISMNLVAFKNCRNTIFMTPVYY